MSQVTAKLSDLHSDLAVWFDDIAEGHSPESKSKIWRAWNMKHWLTKINKALVRKGCGIARTHGHITITNLATKETVCDFITAGMDKQTLLRNLEILYLAVTQ